MIIAPSFHHFLTSYAKRCRCTPCLRLNCYASVVANSYFLFITLSSLSESESYDLVIPFPKLIFLSLNFYIHFNPYSQNGQTLLSQILHQQLPQKTQKVATLTLQNQMAPNLQSKPSHANTKTNRNNNNNNKNRTPTTRTNLKQTTPPPLNSHTHLQHLQL